MTDKERRSTILKFLVAKEIENSSTLEIHNLLGEKIHNSITLVKEEKRIIDFTSQPNGVYYISVKSGNEINPTKARRNLLLLNLALK